MKKKRLEIEYNYDFYLVGIISSARGYKLAWDINQTIGVHLTKQPDLTIQHKDKITGTYTHYLGSSTINLIRLFRNRPGENEAAKNLLVPEYPHFDYIVMMQGEDPLDHNRLQEYLRTIPSVELVAFIPLDTLKSKDYFIF
ncbi:MAG: IPExxxVDY family protein [Cyclobacteriaceae bacterium]